MATNQRTVDFLLEQFSSLNVNMRKMFGEYAMYCEGKVVALVCDDQLFVKPTAISKDFLDDSYLAPPYPGAKNYYCVPEEKWEEREWLVELLRQTAEHVPYPKRKK